jgi:4-amino-4-deoxy-L-arabinose transferase-like glycosyltransferase
MVNAGFRYGGRWAGAGWIVLLAFAVRLGWALLVPVAPVSDSNIYDMLAREIAAGRGYTFPNGDSTVYWPVGPSALYGTFYALFGAHGWVVSTLNLAMGCALVAGIHRLARLRLGERVAPIAALIAALWPAWVQFTSVLNSELPFALLLVAAFVARDEARLPGWARVTLSTALLVAASFMRPTALPLIVILPLLDGEWRRPARATLHLALALSVAAALLTPWAERNRTLFGEPVLISANLGANLWMGNNPASNGGYMPLPESGTDNEVSRDAYFKEQALAFIRANPGEYLRLSAQRVPLSFGRETIGIVWNARSIAAPAQYPLKALSSGYWLAALFLSLIGLALFLRKTPARLFDPLVMAAGLFTAVALLVVGQDRYHMAMMPFIALFAGLAIERAIARLTQRKLRG